MKSNSPKLLLTQDKNSVRSHPANGLGRREFLRVAGIAAFGFGFNLHRCPAGLASGSIRAKTKEAITPEDNIVVGLEIGVSKVCVAVGRRLPDGTIKLLGIGDARSLGVTPHGIVDFEAAGACVRAALLDAEAKSNVNIRSVALAVPGMKIAPYESGPTWEDYFEWEEIRYADRGDGVLHRVSMADCKRTRDGHVIFGAGDRIRCLKDLGIEVERIVFAPVASAEAVLSANQKKRDALVIDMGEGTTDYAVYSGGALVHSDSFPVGGQKIANDLSMDLRIPLARAEKLVIDEGSVWLGMSLPDEYMRIVLAAEPGFAGRTIDREALNYIVHHRVRMVFEFVKLRLVNAGVRLDSFHGNIHLTGGCSRIEGVEHLAMEIFGLFPAPRRLKGIVADASVLVSPRYACAVGLVKLGLAGTGVRISTHE